MSGAAFNVREEGRGNRVQDYWPLIALIGVSALGGYAISSGYDELTMRSFMHAFMGVFLCFFALLKLFNPVAFKRGFTMYDLLARRVKQYAFVYPFLELGLGLAYLSFLNPPVTYVATIALFGFGTLGVISALRRGLDIDCPCMGSILSVPLSTVTLTEDLAMVVMAAMLLLQITG